MSIKCELFRDFECGKIVGVCVGISDYFNMEFWLVCILVVIVVLLLGGLFIVVVYIVVWFILDKKLIEKIVKSVDSIY